MTSFYFHCSLSNWFYYWIVIERNVLALFTGGGGEKATQGRPSPQRDIESHRFFTSQRLPGFRDSQFSGLGGELQDRDSERRRISLDSFFMVEGQTETKLIWAPMLNISELLSSKNNWAHRTEKGFFCVHTLFFQLVYLYVCHISVYINTTLLEVKEYICYTVIMW